VRAAVCHQYGPPEAVKVEDIPRPALTAGHVRVRVGVAAVNFPDVLLMANRYQISIPTPFVPGSEFAGVVEEAGEAAGAFTPGDRVMGTMLAGAFAEEAVVPAGALTRIPPGIDDRSGAAFGVAHRTAYHVLRSVAAVAPGEELVVLGAGGGVGLATVQLGTVLGATVTAVASSTEKLDVAASQGASRLIGHRAGDLRQALREALPDGADVVVDPVGGDLAEPALRALRWGGRFVTVGYASGAVPRIPLNLVLLKGVHILGFQLRDVATKAPGEFRRGETELLALLAARRALPHIGATFRARRGGCRPALCGRWQGHRQGRPRRQLGGWRKILIPNGCASWRSPAGPNPAPAKPRRAKPAPSHPPPTLGGAAPVTILACCQGLREGWAGFCGQVFGLWISAVRRRLPG
jgi:NADPH:quinone reductase